MSIQIILIFTLNFGSLVHNDESLAQRLDVLFGEGRGVSFKQY